MLRTVLVVVLFRHVVLRHFVRAHFALVRVRSVFHSAHYPRFERLSFLQQFVRAFRVGALNHGNAAKIPAALSRGGRGSERRGSWRRSRGCWRRLETTGRIAVCRTTVPSRTHAPRAKR